MGQPVYAVGFIPGGAWRSVVPSPKKRERTFEQAIKRFEYYNCNNEDKGYTVFMLGGLNHSYNFIVILLYGILRYEKIIGKGDVNNEKVEIYS